MLVKLFLASLSIFVLQKPLFMLFNSSAHPEVGVKDYFDVMYHAVPLDLTVSAYLTVIPWLVVLCSCFVGDGNRRASRHGGKGTGSMVRRILVPYYAIMSILISLVFVADTVLYGFWNFKIDSTVFIYTDKPGDALASVSTWYVVMCVLAILVFFISYLSSYRICLPKRAWKRLFFKASAIPMLLVGGLLFLAIRGGVGEGTANVSNVYYSENQYLNHSAVNPVFNMIYSLMHQQNFAEEFRFFDKEEAEEIANQIYPKKQANAEELTDTLLSSQDVNVLLIVWEGCGAKMSDSRIITPYLNEIADEGVLFTRCYSSSFRTDRGLISIMTGWLGMPSASLMKIPNKCNNLPGIAQSLHEQGYYTDFWYGGDISFTNMGGFMLANGFTITHSDTDFSRKERSYSKWGVMDEVLLDKLESDIAKRDASSRWFTSVLTLSSHEPWEVPYSRIGDEKQNSFAYTDECIGRFVNRLKKSDAWKDLLIVIVPDHGVIADDSDTRSSMDVIHIPLVLSGGALRTTHKRIDTIMSQSDLAATLLAQLGIDHSQFPFSRNVLSSSYTYPTAFHTSPIDATFIDSTGITTYDLNGKCVTFSTNKEGDNSRTKKSQAILQTLYDRAVEL